MTTAIEHLTLREKLRDVIRVNRELIEHLELGFVPKVHDLKKLTKQHEPSSTGPAVEDATVRGYVSAVLESDQFTDKLHDSLMNYLNSIQKDVSVVVKSAGRK